MSGEDGAGLAEVAVQGLREARARLAEAEARAERGDVNLRNQRELAEEYLERAESAERDLAEAEARADRAERERDQARARLAGLSQAWDEGFTSCEDAIGLQVCFQVPNPYREGEE